MNEAPPDRAGPFDRAHGPEYVERASRAYSGEQDASKGNYILIVALYPAKAGSAGHLPVKIE